MTFPWELPEWSKDGQGPSYCTAHAHEDPEVVGHIPVLTVPWAPGSSAGWFCLLGTREPLRAPVEEGVLRDRVLARSLQ